MCSQTSVMDMSMSANANAGSADDVGMPLPVVMVQDAPPTPATPPRLGAVRAPPNAPKRPAPKSILHLGPIRQPIIF